MNLSWEIHVRLCFFVSSCPWIDYFCLKYPCWGRVACESQPGEWDSDDKRLAYALFVWVTNPWPHSAFTQMGWYFSPTITCLHCLYKWLFHNEKQTFPLNSTQFQCNCKFKEAKSLGTYKVYTLQRLFSKGNDWTTNPDCFLSCVVSPLQQLQCLMAFGTFSCRWSVTLIVLQQSLIYIHGDF